MRHRWEGAVVAVIVFALAGRPLPGADADVTAQLDRVIESHRGYHAVSFDFDCSVSPGENLSFLALQPFRASGTAYFVPGREGGVEMEVSTADAQPAIRVRQILSPDSICIRIMEKGRARYFKIDLEEARGGLGDRFPEFLAREVFFHGGELALFLSELARLYEFDSVRTGELDGAAVHVFAGKRRSGVKGTDSWSAQVSVFCGTALASAFEGIELTVSGRDSALAKVVLRSTAGQAVVSLRLKNLRIDGAASADVVSDWSPMGEYSTDVTKDVLDAFAARDKTGR